MTEIRVTSTCDASGCDDGYSKTDSSSEVDHYKVAETLNLKWVQTLASGESCVDIFNGNNASAQRFKRVIEHSYSNLSVEIA